MEAPSNLERLRLNHRLRIAGREASLKMQNERVRAWAAADEGSFPRYSETEDLVAEELGLLLRALGPLAFLGDGDLWTR